MCTIASVLAALLDAAYFSAAITTFERQAASSLLSEERGFLSNLT